MTGETLRNRAKADPLLPVAWIEEALGFVVGYLAPKDPRISPLNASFPGAPPVLIQVVTTEILYDDSRRMAANLRGFGGDVTLSEWDKAPHVLQIFDGHIPQARKVLCDVAEFIRAKTS